MLKYCVWLLLIAPSFGYTKVISTSSLPKNSVGGRSTDRTFNLKYTLLRLKVLTIGIASDCFCLIHRFIR